LDTQTDIKKCPECFSNNHSKAKFCSECAYSFYGSETLADSSGTRFYLTRYLTVSTALRLITAGILLNALLPQTNEYFVILRFAVCFTSAYLIYVAIATKNYAWIVPFLFLIALFNPIILPAIRRNIWNIIDVATAAGLTLSIFFINEKLKTVKTE
jgi:hypothetical protein